MKAFEPKWVNSILNIIGFHSLTFGGLHTICKNDILESNILKETKNGRNTVLLIGICRGLSKALTFSLDLWEKGKISSRREIQCPRYFQDFLSTRKNMVKNIQCIDFIPYLNFTI